MAIKHKKVSTSSDDPAYEIQPSHWNDDHEGTNAHTHQSATEGGDLRATYAEVLAGTINDKFATPYSIKQAGINPNVSNTGWIAVSDTWTYASSTTITVPSGAASYYQMGDRIKLTANGVVLQNTIVKVENTLLTVAGDGLTNHSFSAIYYSHMDNPFGWIDWKSFTCTGPTNCSITARFKLWGRSCHYKVHGYFTGTPSWTNMPTLPVKAIEGLPSQDFYILGASYGEPRRIGKLYVMIPSGGATIARLYDGDLPTKTDSMIQIVDATHPITWGNGCRFLIDIIYEWTNP